MGLFQLNCLALLKNLAGKENMHIHKVHEISYKSKCRLIRMNLMTYLRSVNTSIIGVFLALGHLILVQLILMIQKMIKKHCWGTF